MSLLYDKREIQSIHGTEDGMLWSWEIGKSCEKIEVYKEDGQMGSVPWFAIHKDGAIIQRLNGAFVETVSYK